MSLHYIRADNFLNRTSELHNKDSSFGKTSASSKEISMSFLYINLIKFLSFKTFVSEGSVLFDMRSFRFNSL